MQARYGGPAPTPWQLAILGILDEDAVPGQPGFALEFPDGSIGPVPYPENPGIRIAGGGTISISAGQSFQVSSNAVQVRLFTGPPPVPPPGSVIASGTGYTSGRNPAVNPQPPPPPPPPPPPQPPPSQPPGRFQIVRSARPPGTSAARGMGGFDGYQVQPAEGLEVPDVFGTVPGYRWWSLAAPPLHESPAHAEENWPASMLQGMRDLWLPGENTARCLATRSHDTGVIPEISCGCGFWAYWTLQPHDLGSGSLPVCGVIEGYGAVLIGEKGFRAAKARIVALHLPFTIIPAGDLPPGQALPGGHNPRQYGRHNPWWNHPKFTGKVHDTTGLHLPPEPDPPGEPDERADAAEAWMAVIGDRLARMYPGAQVFETRRAMEAMFPPDLSYVPGDGRACPWCGQPGRTGLDHVPGCPDWRT